MTMTTTRNGIPPKIIFEIVNEAGKKVYLDPNCCKGAILGVWFYTHTKKSSLEGEEEQKIKYLYQKTKWCLTNRLECQTVSSLFVKSPEKIGEYIPVAKSLLLA